MSCQSVHESINVDRYLDSDIRHVQVQHLFTWISIVRCDIPSACHLRTFSPAAIAPFQFRAPEWKGILKSVAPKTLTANRAQQEMDLRGSVVKSAYRTVPRSTLQDGGMAASRRFVLRAGKETAYTRRRCGSTPK